MKTTHLYFLGMLTLGLLQPLSPIPVKALDTKVYFKVSQNDVKVNDTFNVDIFIESIDDLFGFQLDMHTSLEPGGLPWVPVSLTNTFQVKDSIFRDDVVYINRYQESQGLTSLLMTRPLQADTGYAIDEVTFIASVQFKALTNGDDIETLMKVSDDLLRMDVGSTNITLKLSDTEGVKVNYTQSVADDVKPTIIVIEPVKNLTLNQTLDVTTLFTISDNLTPLASLTTYYSNFHDLSKKGEYVLTVRVTDLFLNASMATVVIAVDNPYQDIVIRQGTSAL
jgi:hypothetical protein